MSKKRSRLLKLDIQAAKQAESSDDSAKRSYLCRLVCLLTRAGVCELLIQRECLDKVETFVQKNVLMDDLKSCCLLHCPRSLCEAAGFAAAYSIFPFTLTLLLH